MIALGSNVLVRFLVSSTDAPEQSRQARALVRAALDAAEEVLIPSTVLVELVWVMRQVGKQPKEVIVRQLEGLLAARGFVIGDEFAVRAALSRWRDSSGDLADYYIAEQVAAASSRMVFTFDKNLLGRGSFRSPADGL